MTNIVTPGPSVGRPAARGSRIDLAVLAIFVPIPIGLIVGLCSLMIGTDPIYVSIQLLLFTLITPILYLLRTDEKYTPAIMLAGLAKVFLISQVISIFVWHAPDAALLKPTLTAIGIAVGIASCMVGMLVSRIVVGALPAREPLLSWTPTPDGLRWLGSVTAVIGLISQILWTLNITRLTGNQHGGISIESTGAPVFSFLSPLAIVSMGCFAAEQLMRTDRRSLFSARLLIVLAIYYPAVLPLTTKTEPLRPLIVLFVVALAFRWRPRPAPIIAGLALFVVVMDFFYPAVTLARLTAFADQRPLPVVFAEIVEKSIADPSELAYVHDFSDTFERTIKQNYFGRVMGFWDRFTPQQTDQLVSGSEYLQPVGLVVLRDAVYEILPQSFGFKKNLDSQTRIEVALTRDRQGLGKVSWANSGFVGDGFVSGGLVMVAVECLLLGFLSSTASRLIFSYKKSTDILWVPLFCMMMFVFSDLGFVSGAYVHFWTWMIYLLSMYALLWYMRTRSSVRFAALKAVG